MSTPEPVMGMDLTDFEPGSELDVGPSAARPWPTDRPGDTSGNWLKVGAQALGGSQFDYENSYYGGDSPPWRQT